MESKGATIDVTILKKYKVEEISLFDFRAHYKVSVNKTMWHWLKDRHKDQWSRTGNPEIELHKYAPLIFDRSAKGRPWRKRSLFNKWC